MMSVASTPAKVGHVPPLPLLTKGAGAFSKNENDDWPSLRIPQLRTCLIMTKHDLRIADLRPFFSAGFILLPKPGHDKEFLSKECPFAELHRHLLLTPNMTYEVPDLQPEDLVRVELLPSQDAVQILTADGRQVLKPHRLDTSEARQVLAGANVVLGTIADVKLPAGWTCSEGPLGVVIEATYGFTTVNFELRNFAPGITAVAETPETTTLYSGEEWKTRLVNDAVSALQIVVDAVTQQRASRNLKRPQP